MKAMRGAVAMSALVLGLASTAQAQRPERVYPIVELTDEDLELIDVHDGSIEDWLEVVGGPSVTALDFRTHPEEGLYDPADMDFRIWLAWHRSTSRLYVAMERADDSFVNQFDRETYNYMDLNDSGLSIVVDADHSGGGYAGQEDLTFEEQMLYYNYQAQWYQALSDTYDNGPRVSMTFIDYFATDDWFRHPPWAEGGGGIFGENPTISVTELYVTVFDYFVWNSAEESAISDLYPGKVLGLLVAVADRDYDEVMPSSYYYLGSFEGVSDYFASCVLVGSGGEIPDISAVESITWARIKAQFVK